MSDNPRARSHWGDEERAIVGAAKRRTPRAGVPVEVSDEVTGRYEGEELQRRRADRPTPMRVQRLEDFKDEMLERVPRIEANVQTLVDWHREDREERRLERHARLQTETNNVGLEKVRLTTRAKVIVAVVGAVSTLAGVAVHYLAGKL